MAPRSMSRARSRNRYTSPTSTSGSSPSVAEKRIFKWLSVRTVDEEVRAVCGLYEIAQLYAALLHFAVAGSDLMVTDTIPKDGYARPY